MDIKKDIIKSYSNKKIAQKNLDKYLGYYNPLLISTRKDKKYMVLDDINNKYIHFGAFNPPMEDFTKHKDKKRQQRYLKRATKIKGKWKEDIFSPNNLSIHVLWM